MNKPYDQFSSAPATCESWIPQRILADTPTLEVYKERLEAERVTRKSSGFSWQEKAFFFGGSVLATTVAVGALAVAKVDQAFHLGVGERMAHIKPDQHDGLKHDAEQLLHDFGQKVVKDEK
jgi:hypothetical protein